MSLKRGESKFLPKGRGEKDTSLKGGERKYVPKEMGEKACP